MIDSSEVLVLELTGSNQDPANFCGRINAIKSAGSGNILVFSEDLASAP